MNLRAQAASQAGSTTLGDVAGISSHSVLADDVDMASEPPSTVARLTDIQAEIAARTCTAASNRRGRSRQITSSPRPSAEQGGSNIIYSEGGELVFPASMLYSDLYSDSESSNYSSMRWSTAGSGRALEQGALEQGALDRPPVSIGVSGAAIGTIQ
jgi:hypothetical protein